MDTVAQVVNSQPAETGDVASSSVAPASGMYDLSHYAHICSLFHVFALHLLHNREFSIMSYNRFRSTYLTLIFLELDYSICEQRRDWMYMMICIWY